MANLLGIDAGGTKTDALIVDDSGDALGFGRSGPGNHQVVGYDGMRDAIATAIDIALSEAGLTIAQIDAAGMGICGYDWPSQLDAHLAALAPLALKRSPEVVNDAIVALLAGAPAGWGVVAIAGTGNNCRGLSREGREARITGEGERFGEYGGGSEMVRRGIQAVAQAWTRRGPATELTERFIDLAGASGPDDLIEGIDLGRYRPAAAWAQSIFQVARGGDDVARDIIAWSARELGMSACGVIRQLGVEKEAFDVVLAGGIMAAGEIYFAPLTEVILRVAPGATFVTLEVPPAAGGVLLAMRQIPGAGPLSHRRVVASVKSLLQRS